jgi:hypothetical protein
VRPCEFTMTAPLFQGPRERIVRAVAQGRCARQPPEQFELTIMKHFKVSINFGRYTI